MKILHTSDWHIGRTLYGRKRYEEFEAFLDWLAETILQEQVDVLLVAGDVFDTSSPSNRAQELYYRFLCRVAASSCRHVVVVAGNHDSASFLNAPRELLRALNVHVIGAATENREDEVLLISEEDGTPGLIVCAVPYLRDRDIRVAEAGENIEEKERKLIEGIRTHYAEVCAIARHKRDAILEHKATIKFKQSGNDNLESGIPLIAMGHLFTAGGQTLEGDGVRELYVGSLAHVSAGIFPPFLDYLALGHLHVPQEVNGSRIMRYSGSPLPMGFGEAKQEKSVVIVDFASDCSAPVNLEKNTKSKPAVHIGPPSISLVKVPVFQRLERIRGTWQQITAGILELSENRPSAWLEIVYEGEEVMGNLRERLEAELAGTEMEILRVKNMRVIDLVLTRVDDEETLDDLDVNDVFERCMTSHEVPEEQRPELLSAYREAVVSIFEEGSGNG